MTDTPPSDGPSQGAEFDISSAFDWKDGIATLPGSDIRVQEIFCYCFFFWSRFFPACANICLYGEEAICIAVSQAELLIGTIVAHQLG